VNAMNSIQRGNRRRAGPGYRGSGIFCKERENNGCTGLWGGRMAQQLRRRGRIPQRLREKIGRLERKFLIREEARRRE